MDPRGHCLLLRDRFGRYTRGCAEKRNRGTIRRRVIEALKKAIELGYRVVVNLETEPDLDPLRGQEDFNNVLNELTNKAK